MRKNEEWAGGCPAANATYPSFGGVQPERRDPRVRQPNVTPGALAGSSGQWSFTSPRLASGTHKIAVFAIDYLSNFELLSNPLTIVV